MENVGSKPVLDSSCVLYLDAANPKSYGTYNLLTNSEDIAFWGADGLVAKTYNVTTAPNGTMTADKLSEVAGATSCYIYRGMGIVMIPNMMYTFSVYLKAAERSKVRLSMWDGVGCSFDLNNGTYSSLSLETVYTSGNNSFNPRASITNEGDGWYRCSVSCSYNSSANPRFCKIGILNDSSVDNYPGIDGYGVYIGGAQVNDGLLKPYQSIGATRPTQWTDLSGYGNHATLVNSPTPSKKNGGAMYFNGTNQNATINVTPLSTSIVTVSMWFSLGNTNTGYNVLLPIWSGDLGYGISIQGESSLVIWYNNLLSSPSAYLGGYHSSNDGLPLNITHRYDGVNTELYWNGVLAARTPATGTMIMKVGVQNILHLGGWMNQIKIHNRALTPAEIKQDYDAFMSRYKK